MHRFAAPRKKEESFLRIVRETFFAVSCRPPWAGLKWAGINRYLTRCSTRPIKLTVPFGCHRGRSAASRAGCRNRALRWCLANNRIAAERLRNGPSPPSFSAACPRRVSRCPGSSKVKNSTVSDLYHCPVRRRNLSRDNPVIPAFGPAGLPERDDIRAPRRRQSPKIGRFVSNL